MVPLDLGRPGRTAVTCPFCLQSHGPRARTASDLRHVRCLLPIGCDWGVVAPSSGRDPSPTIRQLSRDRGSGPGKVFLCPANPSIRNALGLA
jgi:hypothetical protein